MYLQTSLGKDHLLSTHAGFVLHGDIYLVLHLIHFSSTHEFGVQDPYHFLLDYRTLKVVLYTLWMFIYVLKCLRTKSAILCYSVSFLHWEEQESGGLTITSGRGPQRKQLKENS